MKREPDEPVFIECPQPMPGSSALASDPPQGKEEEV